MLFDISHELRSPLARLSVAVELARTDEVNAPPLDRIQKEADRLNSLVTEAVRMSQIEAGNVYLPDPGIAPWIGGLIDECAAFPNGAYDDQVDAMTQALVRLGTRCITGLFRINVDSLTRRSYWHMQRNGG